MSPILLHDRPLDSQARPEDEVSSLRTPILVAILTVLCLAAIRVGSSIARKSPFGFDFKLACAALALGLCALAGELRRALIARRDRALARRWQGKRSATWRLRAMS